MSILKLEVHDVLTLKKVHPCGGQQWRVIRVGVDVGVKCLTCGRFVMVPRRKLERDVREILRGGNRLKPFESLLEM
ncbi:MAG: DUF951 domain-containing protein [Atribacterota bacterium]|nr:DUF951 domain-containing protein [Candidatus Atribacteria bacterium]